MNLDDLFGDGLQLGDDYLVKAQLKVRVRAARLPALHDLTAKLEAMYDERLNLMMKDVEGILANADARKAVGLYVINGGLSGGSELRKSVLQGVLQPQFVDDLFKGSQPAKPTLSGKPRAAKGSGQKAERQEMTQARAGSRGGKWYVTASGKVRYGTKPQGEFTNEAAPEQVAEHLKHYRPLPFMGMKGNDAALISHLLKHGENYGFSPTSVQLLEMWYGKENKKDQTFGGGKLFSAFKKMFGSKWRDDMLEGDMSKLRVTLDGETMSFQEAVHEFLKVQHWAGDDVSDEEQAQNYEDVIKPLLDDLFESYEKLKTNPEVQKRMQDIGHEIEEKQNKFFFDAAQHDDVMKDLGDTLRQEPDPTKLTTTSVAALAALDLIIDPGSGEVGRDAGHLKGVVAPNSTLLDDKDNPLLDPKRLSTLNTSQLQMLYVAGQLNAGWDGEMRTYDMKSSMSSKLGDAALKELAQRTGVRPSAMNIIRDQLNEAAATIGQQLSDANVGKNPLLKEFVRNGAQIVGDSTKADKIRADMADLEELRAKSLEAQKNDTFDLPQSMAGGKLGAVHQGDKPLDHQRIINKDGEDTGKTYGLFKHQRQGINWMLTAKRGLLAFDAGMGKTPTVITFLEHMREQGLMKEGEQAMIFLPPSVMNQWPKEINDYAPDVKSDEVLNLAGLSLAQRKEVLNSDVAKKAKYILVSTGTLNGGGDEKEGAQLDNAFDEGAVNDGSGGSDDEMVNLLKSIKGPVFIDEVHTGGFKEGGTVRHEIARKVMEGREYSFGMTATPMPNGPLDLFHLGNLFAPNKIGTHEEWKGATHGVQWNDSEGKWDVGNPEGLQEMRDKVRPFVFHKLITDPEVTKDVGNLLGDKYEDPDLTKIQPPDDHPIYDYTKPGGHVDQLAQALYARMLDEAEREGDHDRLHRLEKSGGYIRGGLRDSLRRQAEISPELFDASYKGGSPKIQRFVKDVVDHFKGGGGSQDKPFVMFSSLPGKSFPIVKRELVKAGIDPSLIGEIHGGKSARERAFEQDMTNAGKRKILLVGTKSGGAGLNLQKKANRVGYLDQPMDPASKRQAVGRVWRPGQMNPVMESNYTMTSPYGESWDEKSKARLGSKQALVTAMMSDVDMTSMDFTQAANEALAGLGIKPEARREAQDAWGKNRGKKKKTWKDNKGEERSAEETDYVKPEEMNISPKMAALAAKLRPETILNDPEDEFDTDMPSLEEMLDPKTHASLVSEAKGLKQKMNVKEELRVWDREFDMNAMPIKWRTQEVLINTAKTPKQREEAKTQAVRLASQCLAWYQQLGKEAHVLEKQGDSKGAKKMMERAEKFRDEMPDAFKDYKDPKDAVAAMTAKATGATPPPKSAKTDANALAKLSKDQQTLLKQSKIKPGNGETVVGVKKDEASGSIVVKLKTAKGTREVSVPGKVEETKSVLSKLDAQTKAAKPVKGAVTIAKKSPFGKKDSEHDHALYAVLAKKQPKTEDEAKDAMKPYLIKLGVPKKELDAWAHKMLKHFKKNGVL